VNEIQKNFSNKFSELTSISCKHPRIEKGHKNFVIFGKLLSRISSRSGLTSITSLEMLEEISQKLQSFDDLFNFSGVCTMWRSVQKIYW
jgi:hypothetical protein